MGAGEAIAGAAGQLLSTGLNLWNTNRQNRLSRDFSREMYEKQYKDNIAFWQMQNQYNDPKQQIERLRNAGLNPALLYGGSGAGASGQAGSIATPDVKSAQFSTVDFGALGGMLGNIYDLELKQDQSNLLKSQTATQLELAGYYRAQAERSGFDLDFSKEYRQTSGDMQRELLRQQRISNKVKLQENERAKLLVANTLSQGFEQVLRSRAERERIGADTDRIRAAIEDIRQSAELKMHENRLRAQGQSFKDPLTSRLIGKAVSAYLDSKNTSMDEILKQTFRDPFKELKRQLPGTLMDAIIGPFSKWIK